MRDFAFGSKGKWTFFFFIYKVLNFWCCGVCLLLYSCLGCKLS